MDSNITKCVADPHTHLLEGSTAVCGVPGAVRSRRPCPSGSGPGPSRLPVPLHPRAADHADHQAPGPPAARRLPHLCAGRRFLCNPGNNSYVMFDHFYAASFATQVTGSIFIYLCAGCCCSSSNPGTLSAILAGTLHATLILGNPVNGTTLSWAFAGMQGRHQPVM